MIVTGIRAFFLRQANTVQLTYEDTRHEYTKNSSFSKLVYQQSSGF